MENQALQMNEPIDPLLLQSIIQNNRVRKEVVRNSHLLFFSVYFGDYITYPMAPMHWDMFKLTEGEDKLVVLMAFRGSGKSTIFTLSYPIWAILGKLQKKFIIVIAQTQQQAKLYIANIKRELENNALLRRDLGPFQERQEEWSSGTLVFPSHGARITALSTEQSIRGQRHGSYRPDLIICDDLEDIASVKTYEGRMRTYRWLLGDVIPAGDRNTKTIVIGNMLHEESLLVKLKQEIESGQRTGVFRAYPLVNEDNIPLWPGKFRTSEDIEELQKLIGDDASWSREFMLTIVSDRDRVVHPEWIQYYDGDAPSADDRSYALTGMAVDLAISLKDTADFTAIVIARVVNHTMYILPNMVNERLTFPDTVDRIKQLYEFLGSNERRRIYVESVGYQAAVAQELIKGGIRAENVNPGGADKRSRLALTTNNIKKGRILFPRQGAEELIRQIVGFGSESHDDLSDAFSMLALKFTEYLNTPVPSIVRLNGPTDPALRPLTYNLRNKQF